MYGMGEPVKIDFSDNGNTIVIQECQPNFLICDIIKKGCRILGKKPNNYTYFFNAARISDTSQTLFQLKNGGDMPVSIMASNVSSEEEDENFIKDSDFIICKQCQSPCIIEMRNYKIKLFGCSVYSHNKVDILFKDFKKTQEIDGPDDAYTQCFCTSPKTPKNNPNEKFYYCLSENCETKGKLLCETCKNDHFEGEDHIVIEYKKRFCFCKIHLKDYVSFCEKCRKNLCPSCESAHSGHKIKLFKDWLISELNYSNSKKTLKRLNEKVAKIKDVINGMPCKPDKVVQGVETFYKINEKIINNYNPQYCNFQILSNIHNIGHFLNNNDDVMRDINRFCSSPELSKKENILQEMSKKFLGIQVVNSDSQPKLLKSSTINPNTIPQNNPNMNMNIINNNNMNEGNPNPNNSRNVNANMNNNKQFALQKKGTLATSDMWMFYRVNKAKDFRKVKIFGESFVENNKNKCKILVNKETKDLTDYYKYSDSEIKNNVLTLRIMSTSNIINLSYMFSGCSTLLEVRGTDKWKTDNVTDMSYLFDGCLSLFKIPKILGWSTAKVTDMSHMFNNCQSLTTLSEDVSKWNIENVVNMDYLFYGCKKLKYVPDLTVWKNENLKSYQNAFTGCDSLPEEAIPFYFNL